MLFKPAIRYDAEPFMFASRSHENFTSFDSTGGAVVELRRRVELEREHRVVGVGLPRRGQARQQLVGIGGIDGDQRLVDRGVEDLARVAVACRLRSSVVRSMSRSMTNSRPLAGAAGAACRRLRWRQSAPVPVGAALPDVDFLSLPHDASNDRPRPDRARRLRVHFRAPTCRRTVGTPCFIAARGRAPVLADDICDPKLMKRGEFRGRITRIRLGFNAEFVNREATINPQSMLALLEPTTSRPPTPALASAQPATCRAHVLDTAARLIDQVGPEAVTTGMIAKAAGVSIGWLYDFFPNRESIFDAIVATQPRQGHADRRGCARFQTRRRLARGPRGGGRGTCSSSIKSSRAFVSCGSPGSRARR